jgi:hypothetical protein
MAPDSKRWTFVWGCGHCVTNGEYAVSLDRMVSLSEAMRWTDHLLSKPEYKHPKALKSWLGCLQGIFGHRELSIWPL